MSIATSPNKTFKLVLSSDEGEQRPAEFEFKYLTLGEFTEVAEAEDSIADANTAKGAIEIVVGAIKRSMIGWRNVRDPKNPDNDLDFDPERLPELLTFGDAQEMLQRIVASNNVEETDAGKSE